MKKVIIAFVAGALFATAGTAAATTVIERVTASVRTDYSVEIDGKKANLKNSPLAYNGSSYLPVKEISELLGKDVGFDNGVIKIDTPVAEETKPNDEVQDQFSQPVENLNINQIKYQLTIIDIQKRTIEEEIALGKYEGDALVEANSRINDYENRLKDLEDRKAELTK